LSTWIELSLDSSFLRGFSGCLSLPVMDRYQQIVRGVSMRIDIPEIFLFSLIHGRSVPHFVDSIAPAQSRSLGEMQGFIVLFRNVFAAERPPRSLSEISQNISSETWQIVVAHHTSLMLGSNGAKGELWILLFIWDSMLRRYRAYLVTPALRRKGAVIDGSRRKGGSRDLTICSTPAPFSFMSGAVFLPIRFIFVSLRTTFHSRAMPTIKIAQVLVLRDFSSFVTRMKLITFLPPSF
jgi:hypothetical protein